MSKQYNKHAPGCPATIRGENWRYEVEETHRNGWRFCASCLACLGRVNTPARLPEPPAPARPRLPRCHFCGKYAGVIYTDLEGHPADPTDCEAVIACFGCADAPEVEAAKATLARPWTCAGMIEAERARLEDKEVKAMY